MWKTQQLFQDRPRCHIYADEGRCYGKWTAEASLQSPTWCRFRIHHMAYYRPQPTNTTTLIPFLKDAQEHLKFKYKNITADAVYESEENYLFLESNGQLSYIKPANYKISKTRKYKNDIGKIENMEYDSAADSYICRNGKKLEWERVRHVKSKTGYVSEKTIYKCEDCNGCPYKSECIKGNNCKTPIEERTKTLQVAKTFLEQRKEDLERILSEEGILFRTNRSIQAEGSFGALK